MAALTVPAAGYRNGTTSFVNGDAWGLYWSAGPHSSYVNYGFYMYFSNGNLNEGNNNANRKEGLSVRCVAAFSRLSFVQWHAAYIDTNYGLSAVLPGRLYLFKLCGFVAGSSVGCAISFSGSVA